MADRDLSMALRYEHTDGATTSWPAARAWKNNPELFGDELELLTLRALLTIALRRVEGQLAHLADKE